MRKLITLRAIQILHGDKAALEEILKAVKKTNGNMREACQLLGMGRSSMYRLLDEITGAHEAVDELLKEKNFRVQGKVFDEAADEAANDVELAPEPAPEPNPEPAPAARRQRVRTRPAKARPARSVRTAAARR